MVTKKNSIICFLLILISLPLYGGSGSVDIKTGYVYLDELDNLSAHQSTFNSYEGGFLSLENIDLAWANGLRISGNLKNLTLNNRNINLNCYKPNLFQLSGYHNKYRRIHNSDGSVFQRRTTTGIDGFIKPYQKLKIFGKFNAVEMKGNSQYIYRPVVDTLDYSTAYYQFNYSLGGEIKSSDGLVKAEYESYYYEDEIDFTNDRKADIIRVNTFFKLRNYKKLSFSGGLLDRIDEYFDRDTKLENNIYWFGSRVFLKNRFNLTYRYIYASYDHSFSDLKTTRHAHKVSVDKRWGKKGVTSLTYQYQTADDKEKDLSSHGLIWSIGVELGQNWYLRGRYSFFNRDDESEQTIRGEQKRSRHMLSLSYQDTNLSFKGKLEQAIKEYDKIGTRLDYLTASTSTSYSHSKLGKINLTYAFNRGEYDNSFENLDYQFADHSLNVFYSLPNIVKNLEAGLGGIYYRSKRDTELEKFNSVISCKYTIGEGFSFEAVYRGLTFDNLYVSDETYTANIVEININKNIQF